MLYYFLTPVLTYNFVLIAAAAIPALFLLIKVYQSDRLERESPRLLYALVIAGILSSFLAMVEEKVGISVLNSYYAPNQLIYHVILYFGIVAFAEETSKYIFLRIRTWKNPEFNCQFDGVVYAVFVSLGFALWENISYVFSYGFSTALVRAVTAIPGHASFGVFMGVFYGIAKKYDYRGNAPASAFFRFLAVLIPALFHGAYDFIATTTAANEMTYFLVFIAVMFILSYALVGRNARNDSYIDQPRYRIDDE